MTLLKYSTELLDLPMNMIKDLHFDLKQLSSMFQQLSSSFIQIVRCLVKEKLSIINLGRQNLPEFNPAKQMCFQFCVDYGQKCFQSMEVGLLKQRFITPTSYMYQGRRKENCNACLKKMVV